MHSSEMVASAAGRNRGRSKDEKKTYNNKTSGGNGIKFAYSEKKIDSSQTIINRVMDTVKIMVIKFIAETV